METFAQLAQEIESAMGRDRYRLRRRLRSVQQAQRQGKPWIGAWSG